ncbi:MAG: hypothetical protein N2Z81_02520 [Hydrogenothermaceae bacterium]|nr:hypothetical protein [Hydrogenothermaceae bacterium]
MKKVLILVLALIAVSCSVSSYSVKPSNPKTVYCVKEFNYDSPEPVLKDLLYQALTDAVLSSGAVIECSDKTQYFVYFSVTGIGFYPVGYSATLRANVYVAQINSFFSLRDKEGKEIYSHSITEKTQYVGTGMRADFEKRYAFVELVDLIKVRIYSILTGYGS